VSVNQVSEGFQCCQTANFGDDVQLAGAARQLDGVVVTLSDWAMHSDWPSYPTAGFNVPLTLNIYTVNNAGPTPVIGSLIASDTINPLIAWRPESGGCADSTAFLGTDGGCYHGLDQNVTFTFSGQTLPDQLVYILAFDTETYGSTPIGVDGPYDSLNFALSTGGSSVGQDTNSDCLVRNGAPECGWSPYTPAIQISASVATPEPSSVALFSLPLLALLGLIRLHRRGTGLY
jgi:hypothetical protein